MARWFRIVAALVVVATAVALTACGSSQEATPLSPVPSEAPTEPVEEAEEATVPADAECVDLTADDPFAITIKDFAFEPSCVTAKGSAGITVINADSADHTFTIGGTPVDVPIAAGETFNGEPAGLAPGTYSFTCTIHPSMTGTINVT